MNCCSRSCCCCCWLSACKVCLYVCKVCCLLWSMFASVSHSRTSHMPPCISMYVHTYVMFLPYISTACFVSQLVAVRHWGVSEAFIWMNILKFMTHSYTHINNCMHMHMQLYTYTHAHTYVCVFAVVFDIAAGYTVKMFTRFFQFCILFWSTCLPALAMYNISKYLRICVHNGIVQRCTRVGNV